MRVALLHLNLSGGPEEQNLILLQMATTVAANAGAKWVITPETALQGYFFTKKGRPWSVPVQPSASLNNLRKTITTYGLTMFLGCAEADAATGKYYNSCLVIGSDGEVIGRHWEAHSHGHGTEAWAAKGAAVEPIYCQEMTVGVLVCADAFFAENARTLKAKQAQAIIVPAAWPPGGCGGPPAKAWQRCSRASGLPVWVCNQTGNQEAMDMSRAKSAVVVDGKVQLSYQGLRQAVLLFDWDISRQRLRSDDFDVIAL
jgi:predicted amidohydrolase